MSISTEKIQLSLRDYLQIIFRRKWIFMLPFVVVFFTATIGSFFLPRYYRSSVIVLVEEEDMVNPLARQIVSYVSQEPTLSEQLRTLSSKILSFPHLVGLVKTLELDEDVTDPLSYEKLILGIQKRTEIKMRSSDIFEILYEDKDPAKAQKLISTLMHIFIEDTAYTKRKKALVGVEFAEKQAERYKERLEESEKIMYEFQIKHPLQLPGRDQDINVSMLINYQTSLTSVEMGLKEAEEEVSQLRRQLFGQEPVRMSDAILNLNPMIGRLNNQLQERQLALSQLLVNSPESPDILTLQLQIEDVSEQLRTEMEKVVDNETFVTAPLFYQRVEQNVKDAQERVDSLRTQRNKLKDLVKEYESRIESLPEQQRTYIALQRNAEVNRNVYEMLIIKAEENRLTAEELKEKGTRYEILEDARLPLHPSKPRKLLTAVVSFIIGILSGFGCVFLTEFSDHSFRGAEDAKKFLGFPVLGSIAKIMSKEEIIVQKMRQKRIATLLVVLFAIFIVMAIISSGIQGKKINQEITKAASSGISKYDSVIKDRRVGWFLIRLMML